MSQNSLHFGARAPAVGKPRLLLSFSFGRSSGLMTKLCLDRLRDHYEMIVVAANTGEEREESLIFGKQCDDIFGFNSVWVEAEINPEMGEGTRHRIVTFETATRPNAINGPFEQTIRKYGIPGPGRPHCNREMKANAIRSYLLSIGWTDYTIAIGIRPDEPIRVNQKMMRLANDGQEVKFIYPLIDFWYHDKQDVNDWWEDQTFNLLLQEHEGNCGACWKKADPKLFRLALERPEVFAFPARMDALYPRVGAEFEKDPNARDRTFFREYRNTAALLAEAAAVGTKPPEVLRRIARIDADKDAGCSEACHPYPMLDFGEDE